MLNIQKVLNENKFSKLQWLIFLFTFLVAIFDGMDTAVMGYIAPSLIQAWHVDKAALAPVLSAALMGAALGAILIGPLADKIGRKKVLILSVLIFSTFCIVSAFSQNLQQLEILRFITGLGLGAAMPTAVTLLSEYCPDQKRAFIVNTMYCGFPIGAAIGSFMAAWVLNHYDWKAVLWITGSLPLLLSIVMFFSIPESVRFLAIKQHPIQKIQRILIQIDSKIKDIENIQIVDLVVEKSSSSGIKSIFSKNYCIGTILLWITFFCGLMIFYSIINWMPVLFQHSHMPVQLGVIVSGLFALGGLGAILNGWFMDRFDGNLVIAFCTFITAIAVFFIGISIQMSLILFIFLMILAGTMQNTAQSSLPVLAAKFYPTEARSTGVAWMCGIGRFGAVAGTMLMGFLVKLNIAFAQIFMIIAVPAVVMTCALLLKYFIDRENLAREN